MTYAIQLERNLEQNLHKLNRRDKKTYDRVINKIVELSQNPYLGKPLRSALKGIKRLHFWSLSIMTMHINKSGGLLCIIWVKELLSTPVRVDDACH